MANKAIKLAVVGAAGRMGRRITVLVHESELFTVAAALESAGHPQIGQDIGNLAGVGPINVSVSDTLDTRPDVAVDFSLPQSTMKWAEHCRKTGVPLIIGTTGLSDRQKEELTRTAEDIPLLLAPNMSLGVNLLFQLVEQAARILGDDYDIEIAETHHRFKRDAPSGTALELARQIAQAKKWSFPDCLTHLRQGAEALRQQNTIGMHALRAGDTVGIHQIIFSTLGETIEFRHTAHSRDTFARGALHAAQWLVRQKPGRYDMADVLGF